MMKEYQKIMTVFDNASGTKTETLQLTTKQDTNDYVVTYTDYVDCRIPKQVGLQVSGNMTSLAVKGRLAEKTADLPLAIINMQTLETVDSITEAGIFVIPCEEIQKLTFELTGGSSVTVVCKLMFYR